MAEINISVDSPSIRKKNEPKPQVTIELEARRTLDNNIMIMDHEEIDIIVYTEKKKILALAKDELDDKVYETQDRFFKFLAKKGIIDASSVHSGNVYGSLEGAMLESKIEGVSNTQMALLTVENFLDIEKPYYMVTKAYRKAEQDRLLEPEPEETTELGEVPHEDTQGSISTARGYGLTGDSTRRGRNQHI